MTVRKEDQPKVILLVVALLFVLAFVIRTVMGALAPASSAANPVAPPPVPAPVREAVPASGPAAPASSGPVVVNYSELPGPNEGDPFRDALPKPGQAGPPPPNQQPPAIPSGTAVPTIPAPTFVDETVKKGSEPARPFDPKAGVVVSKTITLNGIVSGRFHEALVSVGDDTERIEVGGSFGGFKLVELRPNHAVVSTPKQRKTLAVGESWTPPIG